MNSHLFLKFIEESALLRDHRQSHLLPGDKITERLLLLIGHQPYGIRVSVLLSVSSLVNFSVELQAATIIHPVKFDSVVALILKGDDSE